jgi:hypothetical protein
MSYLQGAAQPIGSQGLYASALAQQNVVQSASPPIPTLVGAISSADELVKRLHSLRARTVEVAQAIGGPYPAQGIDKTPNTSQCAMQTLNDRIDEAHCIISELDSALDAIRRSLGG